MMTPLRSGIAVTVTLASALLLFLYMVHSAASGIVDSEIKHSLLHTANVLTTLIVPEVHKSFEPDNIVDNIEYNRYTTYLARGVANNPHVFSVYTLRRVGSKIEFVLLPLYDNLPGTPYFDPTREPTAEGVLPFDEYINPNPYLQQAFNTRQPVISDVYTDQWGTFISAYIPMQNGSAFAGVMGIDIEHSVYYKKMSTINRIVGISAVVSMVLALASGLLVMTTQTLIIAIDRKRRASRYELCETVGCNRH